MTISAVRPTTSSVPLYAAPQGIALPGLPLPGPQDRGILKPYAPPANGSLLQKAELKVMHMVQDRRTPEGNAWAAHLDAKMGIPIWMNELSDLRYSHGLYTAAKGAAMLTVVLATNSVATQLAKHVFNRERPYDADPTITTVVPRPNDASFPSGHASTAFAAARVLSHFEPEQTINLYKLAGEVAASRVYAGVHYPSDVVAGAVLGTGVAQKIMGMLPGH